MGRLLVGIGQGGHYILTFSTSPIVSQLLAFNGRPLGNHITTI